MLETFIEFDYFVYFFFFILKTKNNISYFRTPLDACDSMGEEIALYANIVSPWPAPRVKC